MRKTFWRFEFKSDNVYIVNNKQMFAVKLFANSAVVKWFELAEHFHIPRLPYHLKYNWL